MNVYLRGGKEISMRPLQSARTLPKKPGSTRTRAKPIWNREEHTIVIADPFLDYNITPKVAMRSRAELGFVTPPEATKTKQNAEKNANQSIKYHQEVN